MNDLSNAALSIDLNDFVGEFGEELLDSLNRSNPPVYTGVTDHKRAAVMAALKRQAFPAQADVVQAISDILQHRSKACSEGNSVWCMVPYIFCNIGQGRVRIGIQYGAGNLRNSAT